MMFPGSFQNSSLDIFQAQFSPSASFVKDENIVGKKMSRNGQKMAIRAGRLGRLLLNRDPLITSIAVSLCSLYGTFSNFISIL